MGQVDHKSLFLDHLMLADQLCELDDCQAADIYTSIGEPVPEGGACSVCPAAPCCSRRFLEGRLPYDHRQLPVAREGESRLLLFCVALFSLPLLLNTQTH